MDAAFWQARWDTGQIGFHEGRPNRYLTEFVDTLGEGRRVLVPLCGKTVDLAYLAERGHQVVGVELVEAAVIGFFAERELTRPSRTVARPGGTPPARSSCGSPTC
jgi:thiopurine S-methyltransferase